MIGVFDSGLGGLTILKHFLEKLPRHDYVYLGDNARVPYGSKSSEVIYEYSKRAVDFLFAKDCKLIIFACNSASARALRKIQQEYLPKKYPDRNVLGVIIPLAKNVAEDKEIKRVGVIGTQATINSHVYKEEIKKINPKIEVIEKATPLLVPLVEEGWLKTRETKMILRKYLRPLKQKNIDSLILGCTHYPFLLKEIKAVMPKKCKINDPGEIVAESLKKYLEKHSEYELKKESGKVEFYTTDSTEIFKQIGGRFLGKNIDEVKKVEI